MLSTELRALEHPWGHLLTLGHMLYIAAFPRRCMYCTPLNGTNTHFNNSKKMPEYPVQVFDTSQISFLVYYSHTVATMVVICWNPSICTYEYPIAVRENYYKENQHYRFVAGSQAGTLHRA